MSSHQTSWSGTGAPGASESTSERVGEQARALSDQARESAQQATGQVRNRVRQEVDSRTTQAGEQLSSKARDVRSVGEQLRKQGQDGPAQLAEGAADQVERIADYMKEADADRLLEDIEDFARGRPWVLAIGGLTLGFIASRLLKASSGDRYRSSQSGAQARLTDWDTTPGPAATYGSVTRSPVSTGVDVDPEVSSAQAHVWDTPTGTRRDQLVGEAPLVTEEVSASDPYVHEDPRERDEDLPRRSEL
jgi:hypothetical protein